MRRGRAEPYAICWAGRRLVTPARPATCCGWTRRAAGFAFCLRRRSGRGHRGDWCICRMRWRGRSCSFQFSVFSFQMVEAGGASMAKRKVAKKKTGKGTGKKSTVKTKRAKKISLGRPTVTAEEKLFMLFHEDYEARQVFEFL